MSDKEPHAKVNYGLRIPYVPHKRKPTVMISHRCRFYHNWRCKTTIEMFMRAFDINLLYGCKLHYCTGDLDQNIVDTVSKADGFLAVISKSWSRPEAIYPEVEWRTWSLKAKDKKRAVALVIDGARSPEFISKLMRFEVFTKDNLRKNLVPLPSEEFEEFISILIEIPPNRLPPPLWVKDEDRSRILNALKTLGKPIHTRG